MSHRRSFIQSLSAMPLLGGVFSTYAAGKAAQAAKRDFFAELGVKPFINAAGTYTALTSSLMAPECVAAYEACSKKFVHLGKLHDAVGARIAEMLKVEAAMVTSGAAGAITCGTAACLTGKDQKAIRQIPDLTGLKSEVIIQKAHRNGYDHAARTTGIRMVEVETAADVDRAVSSKTAMMFFANYLSPDGQIQGPEWVALGKKHRIPTFADCSADVPPVENLFNYPKTGYDLVTFSGGKGICGPQSAGVLLGRRDLIEAARLNTSPNSDSIARGMKVNKEELVSMMVALEAYLKRDHVAQYKDWERQAKLIGDAVASLPSVTTKIDVPPIANHVPHLHIQWDQAKIKLSPLALKQQLADGEPAIELNPSTDQDKAVVGVWMLQPGEATVVARRLREVLKSALA
ncbi:MAG: aminotransferase class V-fold PLP-dependent enzyme [Bryobacteraceae bacterium]|nr:aminotransferase class V-fold PLP-dependent enzyme [Bryobacteraceae bacterium]